MSKQYWSSKNLEKQLVKITTHKKYDHIEKEILKKRKVYDFLKRGIGVLSKNIFLNEEQTLDWTQKTINDMEGVIKGFDYISQYAMEKGEIWIKRGSYIKKDFVVYKYMFTEMLKDFSIIRDFYKVIRIAEIKDVFASWMEYYCSVIIELNREAKYYTIDLINDLEEYYEEKCCEIATKLEKFISWIGNTKITPKKLWEYKRKNENELNDEEMDYLNDLLLDEPDSFRCKFYRLNQAKRKIKKLENQFYSFMVLIKLELKDDKAIQEATETNQ